MTTVGGFGTLAAMPVERISDQITRRVLTGKQGMIVWWSFKAGVHVGGHSHANEQLAWMLKGSMELRIGDERRVMGPGDVAVIPGGVQHEAWMREDTEVVDVFSPPREDFLAGGRPAYIRD